MSDILFKPLNNLFKPYNNAGWRNLLKTINVFSFGIVTLASVFLLTACQPAPKTQAPVVAAAPLHKHAHATRYDVDAANSTITLRVYRDGPLARFGHNHVIVATQIQGTIYREAELSQSDLEIQFPVASLIVDSPDDRARAGTEFPGVLPAEAIAGTRQHMLGPQLLAAEQYPQIILRSVEVGGQWPELRLIVEVNLRKFASRLVLPVHITDQGDELIADGAVKLSQVQLGLQPYSVLGGGLRVSDTVDAEFHIVAARVAQAQ